MASLQNGICLLPYYLDISMPLSTESQALLHLAGMQSERLRMQGPDPKRKRQFCGALLGGDAREGTTINGS